MIPKVRVRHWLGSHSKSLLALSVILALFSGGAAVYLYENPPQEIEKVETNQQSLLINSSTTAVTAENNSLYDGETRLHNAPVYFTDIAENVTYNITVTPPEGAETSINAIVSYRYSGETQSDEVFWEETKPIKHTQTTAIKPEIISVTVPIKDISTRLGEKKAATRGSGLYSADIILQLDYDTGTYQKSITESTSITYKGHQAEFGEISAVQEHSQLETKQTQQSPFTPRMIGSSLIAILALLLAIWSYLIGKEIDTETLKYDVEHAKYSDWISHGEIPTYASDVPIRIDSLRDLVNIAIDTNQRVIYNDDYSIYGIITGNILYYVPRNPETVGEWFSTELPHVEVNEQNKPVSMKNNQKDGSYGGSEEGLSSDEDYIGLFKDSVTDGEESPSKKVERETDADGDGFNFDEGE